MEKNRENREKLALKLRPNATTLSLTLNITKNKTIWSGRYKFV